jgi:hypothetical protein
MRRHILRVDRESTAGTGADPDLLTDWAALDIFLYIGLHSGPIELPIDEVEGLVSIEMTGPRVVRMHTEYLLLQRQAGT